MYIGPNSKAMVTLYNYFCPENLGKRKNHMGKIFSQERKMNNMKNMSSLCIFIQMDDPTKLLLVEEVVNFVIMR